MAIRKKILVIDDDLFWHRLLKRLFGEVDFDVYAAASCEDGVRQAEKHNPDCILLDFHLEDGDAVDVCAVLKNGAERPRFPVIVVSSDPAAEIIAYAECKAVYFVLKGSHTMTELPRIVNEVLGDGGRTVLLEPGR
ncbi:MAG: response regulator [Elusimicrobiales bacterium]